MNKFLFVNKFLEFVVAMISSSSLVRSFDASYIEGQRKALQDYLCALAILYCDGFIGGTTDDLEAVVSQRRDSVTYFILSCNCSIFSIFVFIIYIKTQVHCHRDNSTSLAQQLTPFLDNHIVLCCATQFFALLLTISLKTLKLNFIIISKSPESCFGWRRYDGGPT